MPLFQYFGWVGSFLLAALFAASWWFSGNVADPPPSRASLSESIHIRIHSDHKWPERVAFDTSRDGMVQENVAASWHRLTEPQGQETSQEPVAELEAFAEMGRETVEGCLQPPCSADQNPESDPPPKREAALLRSHPRVSKAAKTFIVPNPFHKLPEKS